METVAINVTKRELIGKKASKNERRNGAIPCVMYGGKEVVHFTTNANDIKGLIYTPDFKVAEVNVDGNTYRCIIKDIQFHPVTDAINHCDFLELVEGNTIKVEIPVRFEGVSPGVKTGGSLVQKVRRIKVKTKPENLVDQLTLDISALELGGSIRVRDINAPEGIEIMNAPGIPVASVEVPRALKSEEAAEGAEEEEGVEAGAEAETAAE